MIRYVRRGGRLDRLSFKRPAADGGVTVDGFLPAESPNTGQTVAVGQASETDTAQALSHLKTKALAQASETETAQSISAVRTYALGQVSETDTAQSIARVKTKAVGQASETETALAITARKTKALSQASETDTAQSITRPVATIVALGIATETEIAQDVVALITRIQTGGAGGPDDDEKFFERQRAHGKYLYGQPAPKSAPPARAEVASPPRVAVEVAEPGGAPADPRVGIDVLQASQRSAEIAAEAIAKAARDAEDEQIAAVIAALLIED